VIAPVLGYQVQQFYRREERPFFDELYQRVNREALAPFFRSRLCQEGPILDAGAGSGHLARELGLLSACFLDLTREQVAQLPIAGLTGLFIQGDLAHLPFGDNRFAQVVCSNVLHYTGLGGLEELVRVTRPGGQMLVAFLESSSFTRAALSLAIAAGLFPPLMQEIPFIEITALSQLNVQVEDSTTVVFMPPAFTTARGAPRVGLVAFVLRKGRRASAPQRLA
jgi:SAM-dependent methyltransferase